MANTSVGGKRILNTKLLTKRNISCLAIILGLIVHGRFLFKLLADLKTNGAGWGLLVVPGYAFLTSLIGYGVLGLFDLNKIKNGQFYLWAATVVSTLTLVVGGFYMTIGGYFIAGLIFILLNALPFMIKKEVDLNSITFTINILAILATPFSFGTF